MILPTLLASQAWATVSIVSHGHGNLLHRLLEDLAAQRGIDRCLVVVTLNLHDEDFDPERYPTLHLRVVRNLRPRGFGENHNAAFGHCEGDWFFVVNPDIRLPDSEVLRKLASTCPPDAALVAPVVLNSAGSAEDSIRLNLTPWALLRRACGRDREPLAPTRPARHGAPFYWFAGMFLGLRSKAFAAVGGFDPRFFLYCEDYDLCARLYNTGGTLALIPTASVIHDARRDSHRSARHLRWHLKSLVKVWTSSSYWRLVAGGAQDVLPKDHSGDVR